MTKAKTFKTDFSNKYLTIEEAEKLLPRIIPLLKRTMKLDKAIELLSSIEIEVFDDDYESLGRLTKLNKQFHKLSYEFYSKMEQLEDMGCIVKDLELGLIDFYCKFENREIFLCWKLGGNNIKFWHEIDSDYMDRKPILDLSNK